MFAIVRSVTQVYLSLAHSVYAALAFLDPQLFLARNLFNLARIVSRESFDCGHVVRHNLRMKSWYL